MKRYLIPIMAILVLALGLHLGCSSPKITAEMLSLDYKKDYMRGNRLVSTYSRDEAVYLISIGGEKAAKNMRSARTVFIKPLRESTVRYDEIEQQVFVYKTEKLAIEAFDRIDWSTISPAYKLIQVGIIGDEVKAWLNISDEEMTIAFRQGEVIEEITVTFPSWWDLWDYHDGDIALDGQLAIEVSIEVAKEAASMISDWSTQPLHPLPITVIISNPVR